MANVVTAIGQWLNSAKGKIIAPKTLTKYVFDENGKSVEERFTLINNDAGNTIDVTLNKETYEMTVILKNKNGEELSSKTVDFPMELAFVNASYVEGQKKITFTLQSGAEVEVPLEKLIEGLVNTEDFNTTIDEIKTKIGKYTNYIDTDELEFSENGIYASRSTSGKIYASGTATADIEIQVAHKIVKHRYANADHKLKLVGCPPGGSADTYYLYAKFGQDKFYDYGSGCEISITRTGYWDFYFCIKNGTTVGNIEEDEDLEIRPMITNNMNCTYDDYCPYIGGSSSVINTLRSMYLNINDILKRADNTDTSIKSLNSAIEYSNINLEEYGLNGIHNIDMIDSCYPSSTDITQGYLDYNYICSKSYLECNSGDYITLKNKYNIGCVYFFDSTKTFISQLDFPCTAPDNSKYFRFSIGYVKDITVASAGPVSIYINNDIEKTASKIENIKSSNSGVTTNLLNPRFLENKLMLYNATKGTDGSVQWACTDVDNVTDDLSGIEYEANTAYTLLFYGMCKNSSNRFVNIEVYYTDGTTSNIDANYVFSTAGSNSYAILVTDSSKTVDKVSFVYGSVGTILYPDKCGIFKGVKTVSDFVEYIPSLKMLADEVSAQNSNLDTLEFGENAGGKNLLDYNTIVSGILTDNTFNVSNYNATVIKTLIVDLPKGDYVFSVSKPIVMLRKVANNTFADITTGSVTSYGFSTNGGKVGLSFRDATSGTTEWTYRDLQIEEGLTATAYEPYIPSVNMLAEENAQQNTEAIDLKMLGWTVPRDCTIQNYVDGDGVFHQRVGRVDLGSLEWSYSSEYKRFSTIGITDYKKKESSTNEWIANAFLKGYSTLSGNDTARDSYNKIIGFNGLNDMLFVKNTSYTDATTFKNAMKGVYLYYELASYNTIIVDGNENISTLKKENTHLKYGEVAGGKNLVDIPDYEKNAGNSKFSYQGIHYTFEIGKKYTISGKCKRISGATNNLLTITLYNPVSDISDPQASSVSFADGTFSKTFVINENNNNADQIIIYAGERGSTNGNVFKFSDIQLEIGEVATEYEPYIPSVKMLAEEVSAQNESLDIARYGEFSGSKNLFDERFIRAMHFSYDSYSGNYCNEITDTRTYFMFSVSFLDSSGTGIANTDGTDGMLAINKSGKYSMTKTIPTNTAILRIKHNGETKDIILMEQYISRMGLNPGDTITVSMYVTGINPSVQHGLSLSSIQIEKGDKMTKYERYVPSNRSLANLPFYQWSYSKPANQSAAWHKIIAINSCYNRIYEYWMCNIMITGTWYNNAKSNALFNICCINGNINIVQIAGKYRNGSPKIRVVKNGTNRVTIEIYCVSSKNAEMYNAIIYGNILATMQNGEIDSNTYSGDTVTELSILEISSGHLVTKENVDNKLGNCTFSISNGNLIVTDSNNNKYAFIPDGLTPG